MTPRRSVAERERAAEEINLRTEEQLDYAADSSPRVRRTVAGRGDLSPAAANLLAGDLDDKVREVLAANRACPPGVLIRLLSDPRFHVRWCAAQNPSATEEVHREALAVPVADVAEAVGQLGDRLSDEVISLVLAHPRPAVREQLAQATSSPRLLEKLAKDAAPIVRAAVALSLVVTDDLLRLLSQDRSARVRSCVAASHRVPRDVALRLARDRSVNVRWWTGASHPGDTEIAELQRNDPDPINAQHAREVPEAQALPNADGSR